MNLKRHIPNLFTLANLFCGTVATIYAVEGAFEEAAFFVVLGIVFDFFDGFLARLLKVSGELGKQLDSLADVVTSGVAPGIIMFMLMNENAYDHYSNFSKIDLQPSMSTYEIVAYVGLLLTLAACYRLAKFNLDTRQSESFIGLPTPAMSLFIVSLPLIQANTDIQIVSNLISNNYFLTAIIILLSFLMNTELPLFSLKFKSYALKENFIKYLFLLTSLICIVLLQFLSIPLIVILYVLLSIIQNARVKSRI
ncbi:MAG: CDP-alcohol phosphatidyltransferase family protein [Flavobacteriaceae bacterium]